MEIRNIAIIAHVDHGKTTLTDALMRQTGMAEEGVSMDSNALELERGITIYSKNTSVYYPPSHKDSDGQAATTKINIVDTPGHADFGSEVERVLRSIDSVVLVVDAQEGPMPQTKFVLKKSLDLGLKPIVVINKIDKQAARPEEVKEMVFELFLDLGASNEQLDFITLYAIARQGIAKINLGDESKDLTPLLDAILKEVPPASSENADSRPLLVQPFNLAYDNFLGRLAIGRIYEGRVKKSANVIIKNSEGAVRSGKITKIYTFEGLKRKEVEEALAGDIVMLAGLPDIFIGETICENAGQPALPAISIDEPTISLNFLVNNSPFAGREGKFVTTRQLKERLEKELEINVGLKIDFSPNDHFKVYGRGEMHIAILLENMRREGYELQISQPHVIIKETLEEVHPVKSGSPSEIPKGSKANFTGQAGACPAEPRRETTLIQGGKQFNRVKMEPFEEATINIPENMAGVVIEKLSKRSGLMMEMKPEHGHTRIIFEIPTRGLLGYRNEFVVDTRGEGILYTRVIGFKPYAGNIEKNELGSMVSMATGKALGFSLANLQERGTLYIPPATEVYEGMVIGNAAKGNDLAVNPIKGKQLSNMRSSGADEAIHLTPPWELSLERGMSIMNDDEYLEITPKSVRLRKKYLTEIERVRMGRKK